MTTAIGDAAANAILDTLASRLDNKKIHIRDGVRPATVGTAATGAELASPTLGGPAFAAAAARTAIANAITSDSNAIGSGTPTWFRIADTLISSNAELDGDCALTKVFTAASGTDTITCTAHGFNDADPVRVFADPSATLPTGLAVGTVYYVRDSALNTFKLAATVGGAAIDLTSDGTGTLRVGADVELLLGSAIAAGAIVSVLDFRLKAPD